MRLKCAAGESLRAACSLLQILACSAALLALAPALAAAPDHAQNLAEAGRESAASRRPIVLFFTQPGCPFCERARREYLRPLAASTAWSARAQTLEVARDRSLAGFDGRRTTGADLARAYGVRVYPTVVFVDAQGREIAEPLPGYTVPDFYGAYLEARLEAARERLARH